MQVTPIEHSQTRASNVSDAFQSFPANGILPSSNRRERDNQINGDVLASASSNSASGFFPKIAKPPNNGILE